MSLLSLLSPLSQYLTEAQTSERLGLSQRSLQRLRCNGGGPAYTRIGARRVAYLEAGVSAWAASRTFASNAAELASTAS